MRRATTRSRAPFGEVDDALAIAEQVDV